MLHHLPPDILENIAILLNPGDRLALEGAHPRIREVVQAGGWAPSDRFEVFHAHRPLPDAARLRSPTWRKIVLERHSRNFLTDVHRSTFLSRAARGELAENLLAISTLGYRFSFIDRKLGGHEGLRTLRIACLAAQQRDACAAHFLALVPPGDRITTALNALDVHGVRRCLQDGMELTSRDMERLTYMGMPHLMGAHIDDFFRTRPFLHPEPLALNTWQERYAATLQLLAAHITATGDSVDLVQSFIHCGQSAWPCQEMKTLTAELIAPAWQRLRENETISPEDENNPLFCADGTLGEMAFRSLLPPTLPWKPVESLMLHERISSPARARDLLRRVTVIDAHASFVTLTSAATWSDLIDLGHLISLGVQLEGVSAWTGKTATMFWSEAGHCDRVNLLVAAGAAPPQVTIKNLLGSVIASATFLWQRAAAHWDEAARP